MDTPGGGRHSVMEPKQAVLGLACISGVLQEQGHEAGPLRDVVSEPPECCGVVAELAIVHLDGERKPGLGFAQDARALGVDAQALRSMDEARHVTGDGVGEGDGPVLSACRAFDEGRLALALVLALLILVLGEPGE